MNTLNKGSLTPLDVLIVEDNPVDAELLARELGKAGFSPKMRCVQTEREYLDALEEPIDLILCDFSLPKFSSMRALELMKEQELDIPFILVSGTIPDVEAVTAIRNGADDYLLKDRLSRLGDAVRRALDIKKIRREREKTLCALRQSEMRYRQMVHTSPIPIYITDTEGTIILYNQAAVELWGREPDPLRDRWCAALKRIDIYGNDVHEGQYTKLFTDAKHESTKEVEHILVRHNGSVRYVASYFHSIVDENGDVTGVANIVVDMTERNQQKQKILRLSRVHAMLSDINECVLRVNDRGELFEQACRISVDHGGFGIAWVGQLREESGLITPIAWQAANGDINPAEYKTSIDEQSAVFGELCSTAIAEMRVVVNANLADEALNPGTICHAIRELGYNTAVALPLFVGTAIWGVLVLYSKEAHEFDKEELALLNNLSGDISHALDHLEKSDLLNYLSYYDALTGLPNRDLLIDRMRHFCQIIEQEERSLALVLIDIERFQLINKVLGRQGADDLLKRFAMELKSQLFDRDSVARVYGNTFALLLVDVKSPTQVARIVENTIMKALRSKDLLDVSELTLLTNAGVAMYPSDAGTPEDLMDHAEVALKQAKSSPERCVFYSASMNEAVFASLGFEKRLRRAVEEEQFVLHYQPKIELRDLRIVGVEALIRWNDPEKGQIMPYLFIPLLEQSGQIVEVGNWAMRQAIADYAKWRAAGLKPPSVSVNLSEVQLRRPDFVEAVKELLGGLDDHGLGLEITESMLMENIHDNIDKLKAIRNLGIDIAVDDFGTGYSSLQYLTRLPIDALKIDKAFVNDMTSDPDSMTLVSTIISLARNLGLNVIAEGVETEEQCKMLRLLRCNEAQGYLFSRPVPFDKISELLKENTITAKGSMGSE